MTTPAHSLRAAWRGRTINAKPNKSLQSLSQIERNRDRPMGIANDVIAYDRLQSPTGTVHTELRVYRAVCAHHASSVQARTLNPPRRARTQATKGKTWCPQWLITCCIRAAPRRVARWKEGELPHEIASR